MIRRILHIIAFLTVLAATPVRAIGVVDAEVCYDPATTGIISGGYAAQIEIEKAALGHLSEILGHYRKASIATTGIYLSKQMEYRAKKKGETFYYQRIYKMVGERILPKMITLALLFFDHPDQIMTWGPYLLRTTEEVQQLCKIYECVVANGSVTFQDLPWLVINDDFRKVVELAQFGAVDWKKLFNDLADTKKIFPDSITLDVMLPNIEALWGQGKDMFTNATQAAEALINGSSDLINNSGVLSKLFTEKVKEWKKYSQQFAELYVQAEDTYEAAKNFKQSLEANVSFATGVLDRFKATYGEACQLKDDLTSLNLVRLANLFKFDGYSIDQYLSNFLAKEEGHYYRQKFWIEKKGHEEKKKPWKNLSDPIPNAYLTDYGMYYIRYTNMGADCNLIEGIINGAAASGWFLQSIDWSSYNINVQKCDFSNYMDTADENAKGYCNQMSGFATLSGVQSIEYTKRTATVHENLVNDWGIGRPIEYDLYITFFTYDATATVLEASGTEIVYEETFDSYNMDFDTFYRQMQERLAGYNRAAEDGGGKGEYVLKSDERQYYDDTDVRRIANAAQVSFILKCHDGHTLYNASDSWKENASHDTDTPNERTKELAMATTLTSPQAELDKFDEKISEFSAKVDGLNSRKAELKAQLDELNTQYTANSNCDREALWKQIVAVNDEITRIENDIRAYNDSINDLRTHRAECVEDYQSEQDCRDRIPHREQQIQAAYELDWLDEGHWEGFTRVRKARMPNAGDAVLTWTAEVGVRRGESHFLGIRYHRSIITVDYRLTSSTDSETEVEVMGLDMSQSEEERAKAVNDRQRELMSEYPSCVVDMKYHYAKEVDDAEIDHTIHLLWGADRLMVAREVDQRLSNIYYRMVIAERWLRISRTITQRIRADFREAVHRGRENRRLNRFIKRWKKAATYVGDSAGLAKFVEEEHRADRQIWYELDSLRLTGELDKILKEKYGNYDL